MTRTRTPHTVACVRDLDLPYYYGDTAKLAINRGGYTRVRAPRACRLAPTGARLYGALLYF
eukprot:COSAG05_NODE_9025_length_653_cov_2.194946_1_plen_61_part_00